MTIQASKTGLFVAKLKPAELLELAFFALDEAHRLDCATAAMHFDAAALALIAGNQDAKAYATAIGGSSMGGGRDERLSRRCGISAPDACGP